MRTPLVAGNWKMNPPRADDAVALAIATADATDALPIQTVICPPAVWLTTVARSVSGRRTAVGAQNMHAEERGAYTGEVSPLMLAGLAAYCILGHSERRHIFRETDDEIGRKVASAVAHGIRPIVAVGERAEERDAGATEAVIDRQLRSAVAHLTTLDGAAPVVAYEPVWAIGTGVAASPADARAAALQIRGLLETLWGHAAAAVAILYGGSVSAENAADFFAEPGIDGALVGGASLDAGQFGAIAAAAAAARS